MLLLCEKILGGNINMGNKIISAEMARNSFNLEQGAAENMSNLDVALERDGLATVKTPFTHEDFGTFRQQLIECIEECPEELAETFGKYDERRGSEFGYVRKDLEIDKRTGRQKEDPKHIIHFFEPAYPVWDKLMRHGPLPLRILLKSGKELERSFVNDVAQPTLDLLAASGRRGDIRAVYPREMTRAIMRAVHYDEFEPFDDNGELIPMNADVAKRHKDIGGITFQGPVANNGSHSGFQANRHSLWDDDDHWVDYDSVSGEAQVFFGRAHRKVINYDEDLPHRVRRVIPADKEVALADGRLVMSEKGRLVVPARSALVLFNDMPFVDAKVTKEETLGALSVEQLQASGENVA